MCVINTHPGLHFHCSLFLFVFTLRRITRPIQFVGAAGKLIHLHVRLLSLSLSLSLLFYFFFFLLSIPFSARDFISFFFWGGGGRGGLLFTLPPLELLEYLHHVFMRRIRPCDKCKIKLYY